MLKLVCICLMAGAMGAAGAGQKSPVRKVFRKRGVGSYAGSSSGAYAGGNGYGGGYVGGYADGGYGGGYAGGYGTGFDGFGAGFIDPFEFHQQLTSQILAQNAATQHAITSTYSTGGGLATAGASLEPDNIQIQAQIAAQQKQYFDNVRAQNHYSNRGYKTHRYAPNYAAASGSIGPGGSYQTAFINPANPASPNIHNRFSSSSGPGGFKGVSVSSYSSSADVNGKRVNHRGAQTTINDNGKVTSYRTEA